METGPHAGPSPDHSLSVQPGPAHRLAVFPPYRSLQFADTETEAQSWLRAHSAGGGGGQDWILPTILTALLEKREVPNGRLSPSVLGALWRQAPQCPALPDGWPAQGSKHWTGGRTEARGDSGFSQSVRGNGVAAPINASSPRAPSIFQRLVPCRARACLWDPFGSLGC